jgi:hypothetical protein
MRSPGHVASRNRQPQSDDHLIIVLVWFDSGGRPILLRSDPIAGFPYKKNESRNHSSHDKHPVLAIEPQNSEMLNKKLHRARPRLLCRKSILFVQDNRFGAKNILFLYFLLRRSAR